SVKTPRPNRAEASESNQGPYDVSKGLLGEVRSTLQILRCSPSPRSAHDNLPPFGQLEHDTPSGGAFVKAVRTPSKPTPATRRLNRLSAKFRKPLELVRRQVRVHPPGRNFRNSIRPHFHLSPTGGQLDDDAVEDVVLLVTQQPLGSPDLLAGLVHDRCLVWHGKPGHLALLVVHLKRPPAAKRPGQGQLVGVLQLAPHGQPMGQPGRWHPG